MNINKPAALATAKLFGLFFVTLLTFVFVFTYVPPQLFALLVSLSAFACIVRLVYEYHVDEFERQERQKQREGE